jgi:hypothetical protein
VRPAGSDSAARGIPPEAPSGRGCTCCGPHSPDRTLAACRHTIITSRHIALAFIYKAVSIHGCHGRLRGQTVGISGDESTSLIIMAVQNRTELQDPFDLALSSVQDVVAPCTSRAIPGPLRMGHTRPIESVEGGRLRRVHSGTDGTVESVLWAGSTVALFTRGAMNDVQIASVICCLVEKWTCIEP